MPVKSYNPDAALGPVETFNLQLARARREGNPLAPVSSDETPGIPRELDALRYTPLGGTVVGRYLTLAGMSFSRDAIVGNALGDVLPYHLSAGPSEVDPAWDVRKYNRADWLDAHPFMAEHFLDGSADDFPNERRFLDFVRRKGEDAQIRATLGAQPLATQLLAAIPGQAIDTILGGAALRGLGLAGKAAEVEAWARRGSLLARAGKASGVAAGLNLAQEAALEALNPDRDVDEREAAAWALGMGAVFGSAVPLFMAGTNRVGETVSSARIRRVQRDVSEALASPKVGEVEDMAKADADRLRELLGESPTVNGLQTGAPGGTVNGLQSTPPAAPSLEKKLSRADVFEALKAEVPEFILNPGAAGRRVRTSVPDVLKSLAKRDADSEYGAAPVSDHTRLLSLVGWLDKSGQLKGHDLAGLDASQLQPGDTWLIDGRWEMEVIDAGESSITIRASDHTSAIPIGDGETIGASVMEYTVPSDAVIPANSGSLYRAADAPDALDTPAAAVGAAVPGDPSFRFLADAAGADTRRSLTILRTPDTAPLIDALKAKHGDEIDFLEHPQQAQADWVQSLRELDASLKDALPADLGIGGRVAGVLARGIPLAGLEVPASRLMRSPSATARKAGRLFFDFTWPTAETVERPLTNLNRVPAEGILWRLHHGRDAAILDIESALGDGLKGGPITYTLADGETLTITNRVLGRDKFGRAVVDYLRRLEQSNRGRAPAPDAPPAIKRAAESVREYARSMGREALDSGFLRELDPERIYLPRRWRSDLIRLHRGDFKRRLIRAWEQNRVRDYETGQALDPERRPLIPDVVEFSRRGQENGLGLTPQDRSAIRALLDEGTGGGTLEELPEFYLRARLGEDVLRRYREEVVLYFDGAADSTIDTLTGIENAHGVEHGSTAPNVFKSRALQIDETDFADFLDSRLSSLLESYHRQTAGRIASRLAIKAGADEWAPLVKEATGKDLASEGYSPELVVETVRRDFQRHLDATAGDPAKQAKIEAAMHRTVGESGILTAKLAELEGRPRFPGNPAAEAGWRVFLERQSLRLPYMAMLGKMTVSAFTDLAAGVFYKSLTPRHVGTLVQSLNLFRRMPLDRRGLEALYVATADMTHATRAMELGDIAPRIDDRPYGPGRTGRALAAVDSVSEYLAKKFTAATLITRWNTNMKRGMATIVMQELIEGARKMALAGNLMESGLSETDAVARVFGDGAHDAVRMNRLGMNLARSRRLLHAIELHGVDMEGKPIGSLAIDRPIEKYLSPEFGKWATSDRELFETFTNAVNSEVMNLIIEPKLLSRPLAASTWIGRVFLQFQSFAFAWGNQLAPLAAQRPGYEVAGAFSLLVGLGALTDAIHNELSGRRRLEDTARLWTEKPAGMTYAAVSRAGVFGWLARPLGLLEQTPWGIAKNLGNDQLSTMYGRPGPMVDQLGPFLAWSNRVYEGTLNSVRDGGWNERTARQLWGALPFRNLWAVEGFNRAAERMGLGTPIGPEPTGSGAETP